MKQPFPTLFGGFLEVELGELSSHNIPFNSRGSLVLFRSGYYFLKCLVLDLSPLLACWHFQLGVYYGFFGEIGLLYARLV